MISMGDYKNISTQQVLEKRHFIQHCFIILLVRKKINFWLEPLCTGSLHVLTLFAWVFSSFPHT